MVNGPQEAFLEVPRESHCRAALSGLHAKGDREAGHPDHTSSEVRQAWVQTPGPSLSTVCPRHGDLSGGPVGNQKEILTQIVTSPRGTLLHTEDQLPELLFKGLLPLPPVRDKQGRPWNVGFDG